MNIGQIVGNYKIEQKLGEGGMGAVFRGIDMMLEREVAIKVLRPELASQPQVVERFRSEAVTLAKLNHPNVATLYSFFRQGEDFLMVLEFVRGVTLDHLLQRRGAIPPEQAVPLFCQVLDGIQHAHDFGIIHRDIKPANMAVTEKGTLKVLDFGIARLLGTARMTRQGNVIGTIEYMSPEQVRGQETDARSDIYSLGMLLYEMLTGRIPFDITNEFELMRAQIEQMPIRPREINVDIPEVVEHAIWRAIAKAPEARFQSASDFRAELLSAGFAANARLAPLTSGTPVYSTTQHSQPPVGNPPIGYATAPSQPGASASSQPGMPTPSQPGFPAVPSESPLKETRIGAPGLPFVGADAAGAPQSRDHLKETRIGVAPGAAPPRPFTPLPSPPQQPQSFFSKLTWVHYAGAGVAALVLLAALVGVAAFALLSGGEKTPAKAQGEEQVKPEQQQTSAPAQGVAVSPDVTGAQVPADAGASSAPPVRKPADSGAPVVTAPPATADTRPAAAAKPAAQRPKNNDAAEAARRRKKALDALDQ